MKPYDLVKDMPELVFGEERQESPLLQWLMMTPRGTPRWDSAQVLFDYLRDRNLVRFKDDKWGPTPAGELMEGTSRNDGLGAGVVVQALSRCGGKAKWEQIKEEAARILGRPVGHWPFVRAVGAAVALELVVKLPGVGKNSGYKLADIGKQALLDARASAEKLANDVFLCDDQHPEEADILFAKLPGPEAPPVSSEEWFDACRGLLPGRLLTPYQLDSVGMNDTTKCRFVTGSSPSESTRYRRPRLSELPPGTPPPPWIASLVTYVEL